MSIDFDIKESDQISGVYIITPSISEDSRGNIWTSFLKNEVEHLLPDNLFFKHDKFSISKKNVLRGIHGDSKSWKLVTCVYGEIQQVVVDMREDSPSFKHWQSFSIDKNNQKLILIPPNMGNAYYVASKEAVYHYKLAYDGSYIDADLQFTINWNDKSIGIKWMTDKPFLSDRDAR
jgi:dTDP-4-dehydrorhamnose 3,5-epimerase